MISRALIGCYGGLWPQPRRALRGRAQGAL